MKKHSWKFFRAGGVDQVLLERGADIENLAELDLKLWLAIAMPTKGVAIDPKTIGFLDREGDGRIRAQDLLAAIEWLKARLVSLDDVAGGRAEVDVEKLVGERLAKSASRIAKEEGGDGKTISITQIADADDRFTQGQFNGDSIVVSKTTKEPAIAELIDHIVATHGGVTDRCGIVGVDEGTAKAYFADAAALRDWMKARDDKAVEKPLGDATEAGVLLLRELAPKIEDYFARVRLAAFDERVVAASHGSNDDLAALANRDLATRAPEIGRMPIARIVPNAELPFEGPINPAFAEALVSLRDTVIRPLLGASTSTLSEAGFETIRATLASYERWLSSRPETKLGDISRKRLDQILDSDLRKRLEKLIAEDAAQKDELEQILEIEKIVYLQRDLMGILNNFVSFSDLYGRKLAAFQAGELYLDGRCCSLTIEVDDIAKHAQLASMASTYLAYCELRRKEHPTRTIVAAFTAGDSDNLMVGRNGIFVDRDGKDWDATIVRVVENPISIRQAFFAPYKKLVRFIEERVQKRASDAETATQTQLNTAAAETVSGDLAAGAPAGARPRRPPIDVGTVAAIGVAIGGIGAMVTGIVSAFFGLGWFMPLGLLGVVLMISGPSMLLAFLKLRRRNLGPLLDASGWAINGFAAINVPFGGALTEVAALPPGSERINHDPFAERRTPWRLYLLLALILALFVSWSLGSLDRHLPNWLKASHVLHRGSSER